MCVYTATGNDVQCIIQDILTSESEEMQSPESDNEEERKEGDKAEGEVTGKSVTLRMVKKWGGSLEKVNLYLTLDGLKQWPSLRQIQWSITCQLLWRLIVC